MNPHVRETRLLDYSHPSLGELIASRGWQQLETREQILAIYNYVRDEIVFGYNRSDDIPASQVMADGYGQCNTKGILFMALLRAVGIPCRMHGFAINKQLQKGALRSWYYLLSPQEIVHSWVEVAYQGRWLNMEGFILDLPYLQRLQAKFAQCSGSFCGYGVATDDFRNPAVLWEENDTYIQREGIVRDFGLFDSPDAFFARHAQQLGAFKQAVYRIGVRRLMNRNIDRIRSGRE